MPDIATISPLNPHPRYIGPPTVRWHQVYVSYLQRGAESTTHSTQKTAKLQHYLPGTLQQFVPAGTAVHNKQNKTGGGRATAGERRRASDGGRAMYVHTKYSSSTCSSSRLYAYFSNYMMCINSGTAVYNQHERWRAREGGRATVGERYVCTQQYSNTCSSIYIFFGI